MIPTPKRLWGPRAATALFVLCALSGDLAQAGGAAAPPPSEVLQAVRAARSDAIRGGLPPLELADLLPPPGDPASAPKGDWIYRAPLLGPLARAAGGAEGLLQSGLLHLERGELDEAAEALADVRENHPESPQAGDAAFWLAEVCRKQGRFDDEVFFLRLVRGGRADEASYRLGWRLRSLGRGPEASAMWEELGRKPGGGVPLRARLARGGHLLLHGDAVQARAVLEAALTGSRTPVPDPAAGRAALASLALALQRTGDAAGGQRALLELLLDRPDDPAAPLADVALAWMLLEEGRSSEALDRFSGFLTQRPGGRFTGSARLGRALAQLDLGRAAEAESSLSAVDGTLAGVGPARALVGWFHLQHGDPEGALGWAKTAPGDTALSFYVAGQALQGLGRGAQAGAAYDGVPRESVLWPAARQGKLHLALEQSDWAGAAAVADDLLRRCPDYGAADGVRVEQATALTRLGRPAAARDVAESVAQGGKPFADALLLRGAIASFLSRWAEAAGLFSRFAADFPDDPRCDEALLGRAQAEFGRGAPPTALEVLDTLDRRPTARALHRESSVVRARVFLALDRNQEARELLSRELREGAGGPGEGAVRVGLGLLDAKAGNCAEAAAHFARAAELSPSGLSDDEARLAFGRCLYELGRIDEALRTFEAAGDSAEARYGRALCLVRQGRFDELETSLPALGAGAAPSRDPRSEKLAVLVGRGRLDEGRRLRAAGDAAGAARLFEAAARQPGETASEALEALARLREETGADRSALEAWDQLASAGRPKRCGALRSASRLAARLGDTEGARVRLAKALKECSPSDAAVRQAALVELGELDLRAGLRDDALRHFREAGAAGFGEQGLLALVALAAAQENGGLGREALETRLRIGYVYGAAQPEAAQALLRAAAELEAAGRLGRAEALYRRLVKEAPAGAADKAGSELARLRAEASVPDASSPGVPSRPSP